MDASLKSKKWLNSDRVTLKEKKIIKSSTNEMIEDMFGTSLQFGTAGIRGVMGPGTNRINHLIINRCTIGVGQYFKKYAKSDYKGVAICYDNRYNSKEFALSAQTILNEMGINTFLFSEPHPTPELSFAVRYYHCFCGIMITASHNPKEYNGYKVYDEEGSQIVFEKFDRLQDEISKLDNELECTYEKSLIPGINKFVDDEIDPVFIKTEVETSIGNKIFKDKKRKCNIVFSPQCGANSKIAPIILRKVGYEVSTTPKQDFFDPAFKGTKSPNPEEEISYEESIKFLKKLNKGTKKYNLILESDPDGDRVGLAFLNSKNEIERLTGNQTGALLIHFYLTYLKENNLIPTNPIIYESFVTSSLGKRIAESFGVPVETVLTGFKHFGNKIEVEKNKNYVFGYEESYGYLIFPFVRDKDSLQSMIMIADMVEYYLRQGKTLDIAYDEIQQQYGYYNTQSFSIHAKNTKDFIKQQEVINSLIESPMTHIADYKVSQIIDFQKQLEFDAKTKETKTFNHLPKSSAVKFIFEDRGWLAVRPSGTEPKTKIYIELISKEKSENPEEEALAMFTEIKKIIEA